MALALLGCLLLGVTQAQQAGTEKKEEHLPLPVQKCSHHTCVPEHGEVVLDANWRWIHEAKGYKNCFSGTAWDTALCPDPESCSKNCVVDGVSAADARQTYGVSAEGSTLSLQFVTGANVGSRLYLLESETEYKLFKLKNREFSFTVDVSMLECGLNGALYLVEMDATGGLNHNHNGAGAKFGTGYCDAQCPHDVKFIDGLANVKGWDSQKSMGPVGSCCAEMDIWEANKAAAALTAHPCKLKGAKPCESKDCGDGNGWASGHRYDGVCDADGCDLNSYRMGDKSFYGPNSSFSIDTSKPFQVVTQFVTTDGTDAGDLSEIRQVYVQNGKEIRGAKSKLSGVKGHSLTDPYCTEQKRFFSDVDDFTKKGALKQMGEALERGMVLVLSLWDDAATHMNWLDSVSPAGKSPSTPGAARGPCSPSSGEPSELRSKHGGATVKYMDIKYGEIGSTSRGSAPLPLSPAEPSPVEPSRPSPVKHEPSPEKHEASPVKHEPSPPSPPSPVQPVVPPTRPMPASPVKPPVPPPSSSVNTTGGRCCWGGAGATCHSQNLQCKSGDWCAESKDRCTSCNGMYCEPALLVFAQQGEMAVVV